MTRDEMGDAFPALVIIGLATQENAPTADDLAAILGVQSVESRKVRRHIETVRKGGRRDVMFDFPRIVSHVLDWSEERALAAFVRAESLGLIKKGGAA